MTAYVAFFKDPKQPGKIQAQAIKRSFACKPDELRHEIAMACGLARKQRVRPADLLIDYGMYSSGEVADMIVKAHYDGTFKMAEKLSAFDRQFVELRT